MKDTVSPTDRGNNGFGSTGWNNEDSKAPNKDCVNSANVSLQSCDLIMSLKTLMDMIDINIPTKHQHETLHWKQEISIWD